MKYKIDTDKIFIKIEKGEFIHLKILELVNNLSIDSGFIVGVGAVTDVKLGYFDIDSKEYSSKDFSGEYELISFTGNISLRDGQRFIHTHASISDSSFKVIGGHLFDAKIAAGGEFILCSGKISINRKFDSDVGLALWDLENE